MTEGVAVGRKQGSGDPEFSDSSTSSYELESNDSDQPNNDLDLKPAAKKPDPKEFEDTIGIFSQLPGFSKDDPHWKKLDIWFS